jgi:hypothetical protein
LPSPSKSPMIAGFAFTVSVSVALLLPVFESL